MKKLWIVAFCLGSLLSCNSKGGDKKIVTPTVIEFVKEGELSLLKADGSLIRTLDIEIADDDYQRETGLMHREKMEDHQGMLFVFDDVALRGFYMKNTLISLDIVYLDENGTIVSFAEQAKPHDETTLPSKLPAKYVLEINGGLAEDWVLELGDKIEWTRI